MPELYEDVREEAPKPEQNETQIIEKLFKYLELERNPFRANFLGTIKKCHKFVELDQWEDVDKSALDMYGVPPIAVDRINRGIDTIDGIRENTDLRKRIIKQELGDESIAGLIDKVYEHYENIGEFGDPREDSFQEMLYTGIGIRKSGFDFGKQRIWAEPVNAEDFYWGKCKSKRLLDAPWFCHVQVMGWEEAMLINPKRASEIKGLKSKIESEWNSLSETTSAPVTSVNRDYGGTLAESTVSPYPDQVKILEFWLERLIPYSKVGFTIDGFQNIGGVDVPAKIPQVRKGAVDYQPLEGEQILGYDTDEVWEQFIIASGGSKQNSILIKTGQDDSHPFTACCAKKKKSGEPMGYVEMVIPHQVRINLAWAQKVAYNNKSIKSPLIFKGIVTPEILAHGTYQSQFGAVMTLPTGVDMITNQPLPLNTQAIEEGNQARGDMDFAAAATEESLRGVSASGESGVKLSLQQNAAVTPLNKWVKAFEKSEKTFVQRIIRLIIKYVQPAEMLRVVGMEVWQNLGLTLSPEGKIVSPNGQVLDLSTLDYDVKMENQSVSDFNKQQSFNAIAALQSLNPMGMFDDTYMIKNAPIKNVDDALLSNQIHKQDILMQLMAQNQMLQNENQQLQKQIPKTNNQKGNGQKGKGAPQSGRQSMLGGAGPKSPVGGAR